LIGSFKSRLDREGDGSNTQACGINEFRFTPDGGKSGKTMPEFEPTERSYGGMNKSEAALRLREMIEGG